jgi:hypothetical protein
MIFALWMAACSGAVGLPPVVDTNDPPTEDTAAAAEVVSPAVGVVLNEILTSNDGAAEDPDGDADDYVELYNGSDEDVDISDWTLTLDGDTWGFPKDAEVPAGGWLTVWCDGDDDDLHAVFSLPKDGGALLMEDGDGVDQDALRWGADEPLGEGETNIAFARVPDGHGAWLAAAPSEGERNDTR